MAQQHRGDIFEGVKLSVEPKPPNNGAPHTLTKHPPSQHPPHLNHHQIQNGINKASHVPPKPAYQYNVNQHSQSTSTKTKIKKIRLIIPRKRKLQELQNNNQPKTYTSSSPSDCITNTPNPNQPPPKKQRLSPLKPPTSLLPLSMNNQLLAPFPQQNGNNELPTPQQSPIAHKPQPPSPSPTPPLPISTNPTNSNHPDIDMPDNNNNAVTPLPPPPPLQSISPPPPTMTAPTTQINPYLALQSQLATHFQWPSHDSHGSAYTHICDQCGQGFMARQALAAHKGQHRKAKQRAIRQRAVQHHHKNNQYYYPNNSKNTLKAPAPTPITPQTIRNHHKSMPFASGSDKKRNVKRKRDAHNQRDANGDYPTHDGDGNAYRHVCEKCGKGFNAGSALGGHRSVHKRMERMGKMYNKLSGKHEYPSSYKPPPKPPPRQSKPRSFMRNSVEMAKMNNEYSGLGNTEIMHKIMDKLQVLDGDKLFAECDVNEEYTRRVAEKLSFNVIREKIRENEYISVQQDFMADLNKLFRFVFKVYDNGGVRCQMALKLKQFAYRQTMDAMVCNDVVQQQPQKNLNGNGLACLRLDGYEEIADYEFFCDAAVLRDKMSCNKQVSCDGKCCHDLRQLGPYCISAEKWQSNCKCRSSQMECTAECGCEPLLCRNRQIGDKKYKKLKESVREQQVFGIDQHTRMCLERLLPKEKEKEMEIAAPYFIEELLLPAMNNYPFFVEQHPSYRSKYKYDAQVMAARNESEADFMLSDVLRTMLFEAELVDSKKNVHLCLVLSFLLRVILDMAADELSNGTSRIERSKRRVKYGESLMASYFLELYVSDVDVIASGEDILCQREFPIYSKGRGVVCIDVAGIVRNEYIISFLGVVYSPWCWYEKDDRTRWLVKSRGAQSQTEFFNIMLEKHGDDAAGYDLMFVDPSKKGNYGSRLSHSCAPNCVSVSMGVCGKYNIAVYAQQNIKYGQELCFNYNSVTENEQEWQDAVCLCGSGQCHGQFLIYAGTQLYTHILKKRHHFLHRTANLFTSNISNNHITETELALLQKYSLGDSALSGMPPWIRKYACFVLKYIDLEQLALPKELLCLAQNNERGYHQFECLEAAKEESLGLKYVRLSNLVITLNKMNLFFRHPPNKNLMQFPLFKLYSTRDLIHKIWFEPNSIIADLFSFIALYEGEQHLILHKINEFRNKLPSYYQCHNGMEISRQFLLCIRDLLLLLPPKNVAYHHAAADILLFYASTRHFFYFYPPYQGFQSRLFSFAELGYNNSNSNNTAPAPPPPAKKYNQQYVWGQLHFWERHSIESPDSSLSAERRGTICLPNMKCCYYTNKKLKVYNYAVRKQVIKHLQDNHHKAWSAKWHFAFKNGQLYGSPWLDLYIDANANANGGNHHFEQFLQTMKDTKIIYPDGTYCKMQSDSESETESDKECKTNSTNPKKKNKQENKKQNESEEKPKRRSQRLRGKTPKQSYVEPKISDF